MLWDWLEEAPPPPWLLDELVSPPWLWEELTSPPWLWEESWDEGVGPLEVAELTAGDPQEAMMHAKASVNKGLYGFILLIISVAGNLFTLDMRFAFFIKE